MKMENEKEWIEILEQYNSERGRRPMFHTEALELCRQAYESGDPVRRDWICNMGEDARHRLSNIAEHLAGNQFGFEITQIEESGWLKHPEFLDVEEIAFRVSGDRFSCNYITVGRGLNSKWCYAINMAYSRGSSSYGLTVYNYVCADRNDAIIRAAAELKMVVQRMIDGGHLSDFDRAYLERVHSRITEYERGRKQLTLF